MAGTTILIAQNASWHSVDARYGKSGFVVALDAWWKELLNGQNVILRSCNDNFCWGNPKSSDVAHPPA